MKILKLKFKNINSLLGENEIDFTNPVFTNDGLFAITGKTGAGKSSILDAISLALYGKTPRVEITGNENAVMTRGEKDCYSEIVFEAAGKKWKSSWKQERARTGTLKQVERVIADENNKIVADKISIKGERKNTEDKTVNEKIIEILGLTFEQFTKVVMLAQGSFAAFLQADKNEKGELLEQITGTEIYGEISKKVHERFKLENEKLTKLTLELEAIKILSETEITHVNNEIALLENAKQRIDQELHQTEKAKQWLKDLENLQTQINEAIKKLPELEEQTVKAQQSLEKSEVILTSTKEEQKKQEPVFTKVRELDTKISEKEKLIQPLNRQIFDLEKNKNDLSKTIEQQITVLQASEKQVLQKQYWANEHNYYEDLIGNYAAIEIENQSILTALNEFEQLNTLVTELNDRLELAVKAVNQSNNTFIQKEEIVVIKKKELESKKIEIDVILKGQELASLQTQLSLIGSLGVQVKLLIDIENTASLHQKEIESIHEKLNQFEQANQELICKINVHKQEQSDIEDKINLLDENIKLTKTIQRLEEHRLHLRDGEACPLCGALEHPFAKGNLPQLGEKEIHLSSLKAEHQKITGLVQEAEKTHTKLIADHDNLQKIKKKEERGLSENAAKQNEVLSEIKQISPDFSIPVDVNKMDWLSEWLVQKRNEHKELKSTIEQVVHGNKQLEQLRDVELPTLQEEVQQLEKLKNQAELQQKLVEQHLADKQKLLNALREKNQNQNEAFSNKLSQYGVQTIVELKKCLDAWNDNKKQMEELADRISVLKSSIALNKKEVENQHNSLKEKQHEIQIIETDKKTLCDERKAIFSEKSVEEEEIRLKKLMEDCESNQRTAEKIKNEIVTELEKIKAVVAEKQHEFLKIKEQKITEKSITELQFEYSEKKIKADEMAQKIGANNQVLKSNAENLKNSGSKLAEKEKQQVVCTKWAKLNELIGSGDGKKFRNFAQALTFEHLIGLSNRQLQKMSDRYLLKRIGDTTNPFELSVIDKFQNGEERTAQNLSGGEKFIVSLSLALGLANMAGKNMRIDTMFIDEGFGTLDTDYLDVALNALSNLQSEGKIIGVISHLTELKERIATHIKVVPAGNGYSKIELAK